MIKSIKQYGIVVFAEDREIECFKPGHFAMNCFNSKNFQVKSDIDSDISNFCESDESNWVGSVRLVNEIYTVLEPFLQFIDILDS